MATDNKREIRFFFLLFLIILCYRFVMMYFCTDGDEIYIDQI
jgi:hypothetical protein